MQGRIQDFRNLEAGVQVQAYEIGAPQSEGSEYLFKKKMLRGEL